MMKTRIKLLLPLLFLALMLFALAVTASAAAYKQGDILTCGSYPQTKVTDSALVAKLNAQGGSWVSYNYYISGSASDYMQYKDVTLDGAKYRAVQFSSYRPHFTEGSFSSSSASNSQQDENGYSPDTVYWFKYEPVRWRVLDATDPENLLVLSESILDAQAFRNLCCYSNSTYYTDASKIYYANNYAQSDIRAWLNEDFYSTAFSADEKSHIHTTTITNEAYPGDSQYDAVTTQDKVFLLSYKEVTDSAYGFSTSVVPSASRYAKGTDYAKAQGLWVNKDSGTYAGNSYWRLRSAGSDSDYACNVLQSGYVYSSGVDNVTNGVRAAVRLKPISSNPIEECEHSWTVTATQAANCTTPGTKSLRCTKCGEVKTETIPVNDDHAYSTAWTVDTPATCTTPGSKSHHCTRCDAKTDVTAIPATGKHTYVNGTCKNCGAAQPVQKEYKQGDILTCGSYPQAKVTDSALIAKLNAQGGSWVSYNYYISGSQSDYMQYKDVTLDGAKYRAVQFSSYRPYRTEGSYSSSSADNSYQDDNGYSPNTVYWFKYEPVRWRVLDATDPENLLVLSENILDSQAFHHTENSTNGYYANNYAQSDIRAWLNGAFYSTAFSADEQSHIRTATITNEAYGGDSEYDAAATQDKVFLLSYKEATNAAYGFGANRSDDDTVRRVQGTDYAKAQGLWVNGSSGAYAGNSDWRLRSAGARSGHACSVNSYGNVNYNRGVCHVTDGVCAAVRLKPISSNPIEECEHSWTVTATQAANCTTPGTKSLRCTKCGATKTETIPVNDDHAYGTAWTVDTPATCTTPGSESRHCTRCDAKTDVTEIAPKGHSMSGTPTEKEVPSTCRAEGRTAVYHCTNEGCTYFEGGDVIPKKLYGDLDLDRRVGKADLLLMQKRLAGWDVVYEAEAADVNCDGLLSKADLLLLQKYLAGWDVKLGE